MRVDAWHLTDWIVRTRASHIGRATHGTDGSPALVKVAVANSVHFRDEYALLRTLTVPDVVHPRSMGVVGTGTFR